MFRLDEETEVTGDLVKMLIEKHDNTKETRLKEYYDGQHKIMKRTFDDETKPNNKIVTNFCKYITNVSTGYFVGKPVSYSSMDTGYMEIIQEILDENDEQQVNAALAKSASIYGYGVEILYAKQDETEINIRFDDLDLSEQNVILVYDRSVEQNLLMAIRYYDYEDLLTGETSTEVHVYTVNKMYHYMKSGDLFSLVEETDHYFGEVPLNPYFNKDKKSDYEEIMTLNDAYNILQSDDINESEYSNDAFLVVTNLIADPEELKKMKEQRVIQIDGEGTVTWLTKDINDTWKENLKKRIETDIHRISATPNLSDDSFGGNQTGEAMKYKLKAFEDDRAAKERNFKQSLQRRIRLITNILNKQSKDFKWRDIVPAFTANLPKSDLNADDVTKLVAADIISKETARSLTGKVEDPADEKEKIELENQEYIRLNVPSDQKEVISDEGTV